MNKICIVGGCGHVGIPLALAFASKGHEVAMLDVSVRAVEAINAGELPFKEEGALELLRAHIGKNLKATTDAAEVAKADVVVFVTGTPVDEHLNPRIRDVVQVIEQYAGQLNDSQLIVLRSTIFPGVTRVIENLLEKNGCKAKMAFCPERILQGKGIEEIFNLPQLVSGTSTEAVAKAKELFASIAPKVIELEPEEAELAKLMTNAWRYLEFAIANQFYMMAESKGLDFYKVLNAMKDDYPRAKHFARAGFAAGPCLFKDTMQLSAFHSNEFFLGHSAMLVNEGLPNFVVNRLEQKMGSLKGRNIALLGLAFKADNDDTRESLAFKVKKLLELKMANVILSDPYVAGTASLETALADAEGVILGVPHREYLELNPTMPFVDCWGVWPRCD